MSKKELLKLVESLPDDAIIWAMRVYQASKQDLVSGHVSVGMDLFNLVHVPELSKLRSNVYELRAEI